MTQRNGVARLVAAALIAALPTAWLATHAEPVVGELTGVIRSADRTPLAGARLLAAHDTAATVFRSEPTSDDGSFTLTDLRPGTYALAVETADGVYLVRDPMPVVAGVKRTVQIAVGVLPDGDTQPPATDVTTEGPTPSVWTNPFSAGALVLGIAIVVGVLIKNITDDELSSTQN